MHIKKCLINEICNTHKLAQIHKSADPLSVWAFLGEDSMAKLLYLPVIKSENSFMLLGTKRTEIEGFIIFCKKGKQSFRLGDGIDSFGEKIQIVGRLLIKPKLLLRAILIEVFNLRCNILRYQHDFEIHSMMIRKEFQNKGYGSELIKAALQDISLSEFGDKKIIVKTYGRSSKNFYEKNGFVAVLQWKFFMMQVSLLRLEITSQL